MVRGDTSAQTKPIKIPVNTNPHPLTDANAANMRRCFRRACPSPFDEHDTPDMSEVARIAWAGTQTIRWPQQTKLELSWLRSIIRHARARVLPPSRFFPCFTAAHTGRRRAPVGLRRKRNQIIPFLHAGLFLQPLAPRAIRGAT